MGHQLRGGSVGYPPRFPVRRPGSGAGHSQALVRRAEYIADPTLVQARQGYSLLDLKRYVDSRGYKGIGYGKMSLEDLIDRAPVIVPIDANGYKHFVIFRGVAGNRVLLADPAWGNRTMPIEKFEAMWLDYPELGKVGFVVVEQEETNAAPNRLTPRPEGVPDAEVRRPQQGRRTSWIVSTSRGELDSQG